jgi:hypothetical protein
MLSPTFDLQPMSTGDILDRTVRLYRRHFLHTLGIVGLPYLLIIPIGALVGSTLWIARSPQALLNPGLIAVFVLIIVALIWLSFMSMGALARSISERFLGGKPTVWGTYRVVLRRTFSLIWAYFLTFLLLGVVGFFAALVFGIATQGGILLAVPLVVPFAVVGLIALFRLLLVTQVIVIEDVGGFEGLQRSWTLMRGNFWRALLIFLFVAVVAIVLSVLLNIPGSVLQTLIPGPVGIILNQVVSQLSQILLTPVAGIALTLLYYDSRIRKEAFDLEMMAKNLGVSPGPSAPSRISAPTRPAPPHSTVPARPPRVYGAFKVCPKCGAQVPNIQPTCGKCGTRVPFGLSKR